MNFRSRPVLFLSSRTHCFVRWSRWFLLIAGIFTLASVGFTLLDARLFQVSAKHSLETQIKIVKSAKIGEFSSIIQEGDILGRIDIPRLGVSVAVLQGTSSRMLRLGAGHIEGTPLPGDSGNSGIAGHRDTFFRELKDIRRNDEIQLQTPTVLLHYVVDWVKVVEPNDTTVLESSTAESALTLVTCYPFQFLGSAPKRFVVHALRDKRTSLIFHVTIM